MGTQGRYHRIFLYLQPAAILNARKKVKSLLNHLVSLTLIYLKNFNGYYGLNIINEYKY